MSTDTWTEHCDSEFNGHFDDVRERFANEIDGASEQASYEREQADHWDSLTAEEQAVITDRLETHRAAREQELAAMRDDLQF